jgi:glycosyltransferase involved in cell wall biosynthesis
MDKLYLKACAYSIKKNITVVCQMDTQWKWTFKQQIAVLLSPFFHKRYFSCMWVAGLYQYEYARKLGYKRNKILTGVYSADTDKFDLFYRSTKDAKQKNFPHVFLYAGRLIKRKGINDLVAAYENTLQIKPHDWKLIIIGNGELKKTLQANSQVVIKDFVQHNQLINEIKEAGVFCLPSSYEPWGVVIHEFACAGFPLVTSDVCGAATEFVRDGYNGYTYSPGNINALTEVLLKMINSSNEELNSMAKRSNELSKHITPLISSSALLFHIQQFCFNDKN